MIGDTNSVLPGDSLLRRDRAQQLCDLADRLHERALFAQASAWQPGTVGRISREYVARIVRVLEKISRRCS